MLPIRRIALDRRTLLRGGAVGLALPWLDAMAPALSPPPRPKPRALFVFAPNGVHQTNWRSRGDGRAVRLGETLAPLAPVKGRLTVFSGLAIDGGRAHGDGPGDHARATASFLTCAHPRKTGGADIRAGVSIDQWIAQQVGRESAFASLELGHEAGRSAGVCDSGYSCAYSNNVSWAAPDRPVAKETDPRAVFARLFGDPEAARSRTQRRAQRARDRSLLDLVMQDAKSLRTQLGAGDRRKLAQYLDAVRELEQRLAQTEDEQPATPVPEGLLAGGGGFPERVQLMYELVLLAFATDRTRVVTLMLGNGGSNRSYRFLGVPEGHHSLSHHGRLAPKLAAIAKIDRFHVEQLSLFLQRLAAEQDGDNDLLHGSMVLYGSGIGDGNRHNHDDLPVLLAGEGAGRVKARGHVTVTRGTPMANLYLSMAHAMGCRAASFADSTEALSI
ncbi:MAG TPA: DUF1552 domain-containing protein [bacterium]|nr:DUF1552 domain-containing protein [bacterium]